MPQANIGQSNLSANCGTLINSTVEEALLENQERFLHLLRRKLGSFELAAEVFQDFCERALRKGPSLRDRGSVVPWLYRVLASSVTDYMRGEINRRRFEAEYAAQQQVVDQQTECEGSIYACLCLHEILPKLRPDYADLLFQLDLQGESRDEVARRLGITGNNIAVRLHRARQAMKRALLLSCDDCLDDGFLDCACGPTANNRIDATHTFGNLVARPV